MQPWHLTFYFRNVGSPFTILCCWSWTRLSTFKYPKRTWHNRMGVIHVYWSCKIPLSWYLYAFSSKNFSILISYHNSFIIVLYWVYFNNYKVFLKQRTYQTFEMILSPIPSKTTLTQPFPCGIWLVSSARNNEFKLQSW
jgi:hypothetical protein